MWALIDLMKPTEYQREPTVTWDMQQSLEICWNLLIYFRISLSCFESLESSAVSERFELFSNSRGISLDLLEYRGMPKDPLEL